MLEILDKLGLIELAVERSRLTGLPPDRVASSVAAFDFLQHRQIIAVYEPILIPITDFYGNNFFFIQ